MATIDGYIPDAGLTVMAKQLGGVDSVAAFTYIAVGSGSTANATSTTTLATEITDSGFARVQVTPTTTGQTTSWATTFTATATATVREIGLFNASSGPTLGLRGVLPENKVFADTDTYEVTIEIDNARTA